MPIRDIIEKTIKLNVLDYQNVKVFMDSITKKYVKIDKVEKVQHFSLLTKTIYDEVNGVYEQIMKLVHKSNWLKYMNVNLGDNFLI